MTTQIVRHLQGRAVSWPRVYTQWTLPLIPSAVGLMVSNLSSGSVLHSALRMIDHEYAN